MHTGRKNTVQSSIDDNSVDSPHVKAELTSHQYKVSINVSAVMCGVHEYQRLSVSSLFSLSPVLPCCDDS